MIWAKLQGTDSSPLRKRVKVNNLENTIIYHEVDFLLPAQRFNINFTYITQKGFPFVREYVLRLVHLSPMTKSQISMFFGFSRNETEEAIDDLVDRGDLTLSPEGRLVLTDKAAAYFLDIGEVPRLSQLRDSGTCLTFDLATFTCLGKDISADKWRNGIPVLVNDNNASQSEALVEKNFQRQFQEILNKGLLSKSLEQEEKDVPSIYTVNSVNKIRQVPLRLGVKFAMDEGGRSVERDDFAVLKSSDYVQERIAVELDRLSRPNNFMEIAKAMLELGDSETIKLFDSKTSSLNLQFLADLTTLERNDQNKRASFVGPIYASANWAMIQRHLAPFLKSRIESRADVGHEPFVWVAPSDPYWSKSSRLPVSISDFLKKASTNAKKLYSPTLYLPVSNKDDNRSARQWKLELDPYVDDAHGLVEGFLGGNVEILTLKSELAVVVYHLSLPGIYPVTLPVGFISTESEFVASLERIVHEFISSTTSHERPNDCGPITRISGAARASTKILA